MSSPLELSLEPLDEHHFPLLAHAAMLGTNITAPEGTTRYIGYGYTKQGYGAACIADVIETEYIVEPHVIWFPWTSPRDRMKNFEWAVEFFAKEKPVFLIAQKDQMNMFEWYTKKGFLRKVGHLNNVTRIEEIHMYQYVGRK